MLRTTSLIFEYAIDNGYINQNPSRKIKLPMNCPKTERLPLTEYEQKLILNSNHRATLPALIMMLCGLRKGEVIPLQWEDIDLNKGIVKITKSVSITGSNLYQIKNGTKNGKNRIVAIPKILIQTLLSEQEKSHSIYLTGKNNDTIHTPSSFSQMWSSFEKNLNHQAYMELHNDNSRSYFDPKGIPCILQHITPHMLRHTYATLLYSAGVDVLTASKMMGHSNIETTLKIYTHLQEATMQYSIDSFDSYIEKWLK